MSDYVKVGYWKNRLWIHQRQLLSATTMRWPCAYCGHHGKEPLEVVADGRVFTPSRDRPCRICHGEGDVAVELDAEPVVCTVCGGQGRTLGKVTDDMPTMFSLGNRHSPVLCKRCSGLGVIQPSGKPLRFVQQKGLLSRLRGR